MATGKFFGKIGYGVTVESAPGVSKKQIHERSYYGDITQNSRQLQDADKLNKDFTVSNSISIIADAYANDNFFAIEYVRWAGARWTVTDVRVASPRLILRLGGVYNGTGSVSETSTPGASADNS